MPGLFRALLQPPGFCAVPEPESFTSYLCSGLWPWVAVSKVACLLIQKPSGFANAGGAEQGTIDQNLTGPDLANGFASSRKLCLIC